MNLPSLVLFLLAVFLGVNFGWRTWKHWKDTGTTGYRGISGEPGSVEWFGGTLFAVGMVFGVAGPVVELAGVALPRIEIFYGWVTGPAVLAVACGIAGTTWAQWTMGDSWRIGVQQSERTELVLTGPFRFVRNPIFTSMLLTSMGLALLLPTVLMIAAFACLLVAIQIQVRLIEEPYLSRTHGASYAHYRSRVGRFVPGIGRSNRSGGAGAE